METVFIIEKNIPMTKQRKTSNVFPFERMEIGDSFAVKSEKYKNPRAYQALIGSSARNYCKQRGLGWKFITSVINNDTVRVWRVK